MFDLATQLTPGATYTDGYETVSFYQRLSAACARHGQESGSTVGAHRTHGRING